MSENPLANYFRQPSIYISLPSKGKFYPKGTLDMPKNDELPVYPMTATDEITYKTPDALFNGSAIIKVIESCVPNIKDAWEIPISDIDLILTAIRIASYGHTLDIETTCPECKEEASYGFDLRTVIDNIKSPDYDEPLTIGDLEVYLKPLNYRDINENNIAQFEEQKLNAILQDAEMPEDEKLKLLTEAFKKVSELTIHSMTNSIDYIKTEDTVVKDKKHIDEFLHQCERQTFESIKERIVSLRIINDLKPLDIKCSECEHEYKQPFTLDMTNFFG